MASKHVGYFLRLLLWSLQRSVNDKLCLELTNIFLLSSNMYVLKMLVCELDLTDLLTTSQL